MKEGERRLVVDIPEKYMDYLDYIRSEIHVPKKGIVKRALRDYFYKHRNILRENKAEEFLVKYLEGN